MTTKRNIKRAIIPCTAILLAAATSAHADINSVLSQWNLATFGNLNEINETEGRAFIGGNATKINSFNIAIAANAAQPADVSFAVAGNVAGGNPIQVNHGSIAVGGGANSRVFNKEPGATTGIGSAWPAANSPLNEIAGASAYWSTLAENSFMSVNGSTVVFNCAAGASLAIFNVTDADTFERFNFQGLNLVLDGSTSTILINVNSLDGSVNWNQGSFFSSFNENLDGRILFNFYNAQSIHLQDHFDGSLVAPGADITANNNVNGDLYCNNLLQIGEVHLRNWNGNLAVPEPATGTIAALGMLLFAGIRRMKR